MADNIVLSAGTADGATLATDDAGAAGHVQLVKLAIATDGSATPIPADGTAGLTVTLTAQPGVDLFDCTVNNAAGTASVPVQGAAAAGAAVAGNPVLVGGSDGANARALTVSATDGLLVNLGTNNDVTATLAAETTKVIGTINVADSQTIAVTQATGTNLHAVVDSGTITTITNAVAVTNAGLTAIAGAIAGTEVQVDVLTMPTTTVQATNLDIRDLTSASDSVAAVAAGDIAHDSADSGNPVKIGAKAVTALPAVVAANDRTNAISDVHGRLIIANEAPGDLISAGQTATVADTTATDVLGAAGASTKWRITAIGVYNSDATVGTWVKIQDDTAGTPVVYWRGYAAALGGGFNLNFNPPLPASGQANGKIQMVCETTSAEVGVSVCAFKIPG